VVKILRLSPTALKKALEDTDIKENAISFLKRKIVDLIKNL